jgi:hypothetical protein
VGEELTNNSFPTKLQNRTISNAETNNKLQRIAVNGFSLVFFYNIANMYSNIFNGLLVADFQIHLDNFYKQKYDGSLFHGDKLEADNMWALYKLQGAGSVN